MVNLNNLSISTLDTSFCGKFRRKIILVSIWSWKYYFWVNHLSKTSTYSVVDFYVALHGVARLFWLLFYRFRSSWLIWFETGFYLTHNISSQRKTRSFCYMTKFWEIAHVRLPTTVASFHLIPYLPKSVRYPRRSYQTCCYAAPSGCFCTPSRQKNLRRKKMKKVFAILSAPILWYMGAELNFSSYLGFCYST